VRRSNALLDWAYGDKFRYSENMSVGSSALAPVASAVVTGVGNAMFGLGSRYFRLLPRRLVERMSPNPAPVPARRRASVATTRSRPTPPQPPAPVMWRAWSSGATPATKPPRCCWASRLWRSRSTATRSPSCAACSHPRPRWVRRCRRDSRAPVCRCRPNGWIEPHCHNGFWSRPDATSVVVDLPVHPSDEGGYTDGRSR
jgi:hypothetical protein